MKIAPSLAGALLLALVLAGCDRSTVQVDGNSGMQRITVQSDRVGIKATDGSTAWIDATGAMTIDGKAVALNPSQRVLATNYFVTATGIRSDGVAVGKAGAAVAGKAVSSVVQGLASGNPDEIGQKIEAEAMKMEGKAMLLCRRVGQLQATQDALATALPAFAPYATISKVHADDCGQDRIVTRTDTVAEQP